MNKPGNTPGRLKALLWLCIFSIIVSLGVNLLIYSVTQRVSKTIGKDTVPSIVAVSNINALLADAHSNAMNAMVTNEKRGGKFWSLYRKSMEDLHSRLLDISKDNVLGSLERKQILAIMSNVSSYEYTLGGAVSTGAEISVDQFGEANRLMQQKILPASVALNKAYCAYLDGAYNNYIKYINIAIIFMVVIGLISLVILVSTQGYLFKKTHRIFNVGLSLTAVLFIIIIVYSMSALNSVKSDLHIAKGNAFDSIKALWNARATAYNANALESLYLLHNGTGIVQTADTINFNLSASIVCSDSSAALNGENFEGYLGDILGNITFQGEKEAASEAVLEWVKYVEIDRQIRSFEYDSRHNEAIALNVGESLGQSDYTFEKFDSALKSAIDINQEYYDSSMNSTFKTLGIFPYVTVAFLIIMVLLCVLGMKPRIEEYKA